MSELKPNMDMSVLSRSYNSVESVSSTTVGKLCSNCLSLGMN